jgi:very-short-patch-repair endonuclease
VTVGPYTLDFYAPATRLAVELDGSGHFEEPGLARDAVRDAYLASRGIRVLRFTDRELLLEREAVLEVIWRAIQAA